MNNVVQKFKHGRSIRKMQDASGGPLRAPSYLDKYSPIWVKQQKEKEQKEDEQYNKEMSQPYYKTHKKPTKEQWRRQNQQRQQNQGTITQGEYNNSISRNIVRPINNYFRELKYDLSQENIPKGKYTIPAAILGGVGIGSLFDIPIFVNAAAIGGAEGANLTANGASRIITGRNLAQNVSKYTGLDIEPAEIVSSLPTALIGGNWGINFLKRGVETGMRTTQASNPLPHITSGITNMAKGYYGGKKRLFDIGKYILTGKKTGSQGYYNSFAISNDLDGTKPFLDYNGFLWEDARSQGHNDIIDAFLYKKDIDPYFGLEKVAKGKDFGIHEGYVYENYPGKAKNIKVYDTNVPESEYYQKTSEKIIPKEIEGTEGSFQTIGPDNQQHDFNAAGHLIQKGVTESGKEANMHQDIWKFNYKDYWKKWIEKYLEDVKGSEYQQHLRKQHPIKYKIKDNFDKLLLKQGLKTVDYLGTPIIVRTQWGVDADKYASPGIL